MASFNIKHYTRITVLHLSLSVEGFWNFEPFYTLFWQQMFVLSFVVGYASYPLFPHYTTVSDRAKKIWIPLSIQTPYRTYCETTRVFTRVVLLKGIVLRNKQQSSGKMSHACMNLRMFFISDNRGISLQNQIGKWTFLSWFGFCVFLLVSKWIAFDDLPKAWVNWCCCWEHIQQLQLKQLFRIFRHQV